MGIQAVFNLKTCIPLSALRKDCNWHPIFPMNMLMQDFSRWKGCAGWNLQGIGDYPWP